MSVKFLVSCELDLSPEDFVVLRQVADFEKKSVEQCARDCMMDEVQKRLYQYKLDSKIEC